MATRPRITCDSGTKRQQQQRQSTGQPASSNDWHGPLADKVLVRLTRRGRRGGRHSHGRLHLDLLHAAARTARGWWWVGGWIGGWMDGCVGGWSTIACMLGWARRQRASWSQLHEASGAGRCERHQLALSMTCHQLIRAQGRPPPPPPPHLSLNLGRLASAVTVPCREDKAARQGEQGLSDLADEAGDGTWGVQRCSPRADSGQPASGDMTAPLLAAAHRASATRGGGQVRPSWPAAIRPPQMLAVASPLPAVSRAQPLAAPTHASSSFNLLQLPHAPRVTT